MSNVSLVWLHAEYVMLENERRKRARLQSVFEKFFYEILYHFSTDVASLRASRI